MSLNKDRRRLAYKNVKSFMKSRAQELRFNLHPQLERKEDLEKDMKFLKMLGYKPNRYETTCVSSVYCENLGEEKGELAMNFNTAGRLNTFCGN